MKKNVISWVIILLSICVLCITIFMPYQKSNIHVYSNNKIIKKYTLLHQQKYNELTEEEFNQIEEQTKSYKDNFSYQINQDEVEITDYKGDSKEVIIPKTIEGKKVTVISLKLEDNVEKIYFPSSIEKINSIVKNDKLEITLYSTNNSVVKEYADKNQWKYEKITSEEFEQVEEMESSYKDNFSYRINQDEVEITDYKRDSKEVIIPKTIDGKKVAIISLKLEDNVEKIYFPSSIQKVNSITKSDYNICLSLAIELIGLLITLIVLKILEQNNKEGKFIYISSLYIVTVLYFVGINGISYFRVEKLILLSVILTIIYIVLTILVLSFKDKLYQYDKRTMKSNNFIECVTQKAIKLNSKELLEIIKYSDPVSTSQSKILEIEIMKKVENISTENDLQEINEVIQLIKERNKICKKTKI